MCLHLILINAQFFTSIFQGRLKTGFQYWFDKVIFLGINFWSYSKLFNFWIYFVQLIIPIFLSLKNEFNFSLCAKKGLFVPKFEKINACNKLLSKYIQDFKKMKNWNPIIRSNRAAAGSDRVFWFGAPPKDSRADPVSEQPHQPFLYS